MTAAVNMSVNNFDKILNNVHLQIDRRNCRCISSLIYISIFSTYLFDKVINAKSIFLFINATFGGLETTGRVATRLSAVWYKIPDSTKKKPIEFRYPISVCRIRACGDQNLSCNNTTNCKNLI